MTILNGIGRNMGVGRIWKLVRNEYRLLVRRQTIRDIIKIIQPRRHIEMRKGRLHRRKYKVKGPNYIWHVDGNDKLKPYGFCISGAIDGWSRRIMWLDVDKTNKDPNLICTYYLHAIKHHGLVPCIVRMDRGTENVHIADVQMLLRSSHSDDLKESSVMFGSSNHNQRIERWWGYCRNTLLQTYMDKFKDLELSGILQMGNKLHLVCLKFCFMNVLRKKLSSLAAIWNTHRVRKMKNVDCPCGVPEFLFNHPEYYQATQQGLPVDMKQVNLCQDIYFYEKSSFGSADIFNEWALGVMVKKHLHLPDTFDDAFQLFCELIMIICEDETN